MRGLLLLLVGCGLGETLAPPAPPSDPDAHPLADEAYGFCHRPGVEAWEAMRWCELADEAEGVCPGLEATCDGAEPVVSLAGCLGGLPGGGDRFGGMPERPSTFDMPKGCDPPEVATPDMTWVKLVFPVGVLALLLVLARVVIAVSGRGGAPRRSPARWTDAPEASAGPRREDPLAAARAALEAGRYDEAIALAREAALRHLIAVRHLPDEPTRTDRERLRVFQGDAGGRDALRALVSAVEAWRWAGRPADAALGRRALEAAGRLVGTLLLVGVMLAAPAQASDRFGVAGDAALERVFRDAGFEVHWRLGALSALEEEVDVLVLDLEGVRVDEAARERIVAWVEDGGVLLVSGPDLGELFFEADLLSSVEPEARLGAGEGLNAAGLTLPRWPDGPAQAWAWFGGEPLVTVTGLVPPEDLELTDDDAELQDEGTVIGVVRRGDGAAVLFSDASLLWNAAMLSAANRELVAALPSLAAERDLDGARLDLATLAHGSIAPLESLRAANLLPLMLHLAVLWLSVALWQGWPFGPLREPAEAGRGRFADHVRALATRYRGAGELRRARSGVARLWLERLGARGLELAARSDGRTEDEARSLVVRVTALADDPDGLSQPEDEQTLEDLWTTTRRR